MKDAEVAGVIIDRLLAFDGADLSGYITAEAKGRYLQHLLETHWEEICGKKIAANCQILKLEEQGSAIVIRAKSSAWANNLFMMKRVLLQKINAFFAGKLQVREMKLQTGNLFQKHIMAQNLASEEEKKAENHSICPRCGAIIRGEKEICSICLRQEKEEKKIRIAELLRIQPWLDYRGIQEYYVCERMLFTVVRDNVSSVYFEKVRQDKATTTEKMLAVMFLTGKKPEEIDEKQFSNAVEYLRKEHGNVSASGNGLYGKNK